jgi:DNA-directed RNA polymerase subunit RPC12/RpoP
MIDEFTSDIEELQKEVININKDNALIDKEVDRLETLTEKKANALEDELDSKKSGFFSKQKANAEKINNKKHLLELKLERKTYIDAMKNKNLKGKKTNIVCPECLSHVRITGMVSVPDIYGNTQSKALSGDGNQPIVVYLMQTQKGLECPLCNYIVPKHLIF